MTRQCSTRPPLDELRLRLLSTEGQLPLRIAGDRALVRLPDGTFGVVATFGQSTKKLHVLTEQGTVRVDGDQLVQALTYCQGRYTFGPSAHLVTSPWVQFHIKGIEYPLPQQIKLGSTIVE